MERLPYNGEVGSIKDFASVGVYNGYYIGNFAAYAQMADPNLYKTLKQYFKWGDLWINVKDTNRIKFEGNDIMKASE